MAGYQVRAQFATLDQLAADQGGHAGNIETIVRRCGSTP